MADDLIKRLRSQKAVDGRPHEIEQLTDEAAAMIEQQAARIAKLEAQIAAVAPAVDAQPVAWIDEYALRSLESNATAVCAPIGMRDENQTIPLYASAQSEGLRKDAIRREALEEAAAAVRAEQLADPTDSPDDIAYDLAVRDCAAAIRALSQKDPQ